MITLAWYNIVAIIVGILWIVWVRKMEDEDRFGIGTLFAVGVGVAFFAIWGGIFWW